MDGGGGGGGGRDRSTFDDDLFRCVDAMEVNAIEASAAEGARDGERQGRLEGEHAGIQAGFMIGLEVRRVLLSFAVVLAGLNGAL